jgi:cell division protein FtsN
MEIIIGILLVVGIAYIFIRSNKKTEVAVEESAPYKVDAPAPAVAEEVVEAPAKPARKPRAPKADKPAAKKTAKKPTAKKTVTKKSKVK